MTPDQYTCLAIIFSVSCAGIIMLALLILLIIGTLKGWMPSCSLTEIPAAISKPIYKENVK